MALRKILTDKDPALHKVCKTVTAFDEKLHKLLDDMADTLVETDGEQIGAEGCLSVPGKYGLVKRPYYAKVRAQDRDGEWFEAEGEELIARCFCHELDHLDGVIYTQVMDRWLTEDEM